MTGDRERLLSVIVPAYNEERFIGQLLAKVLELDVSPLGIRLEVIVVDDGSSDRTSEIARGTPGVIVHRLEKNGGKGTAVRKGIEVATGDFLIIQDADLEYDPQDYLPMLEVLLSGECDAVYGSRYLGDPGKSPIENFLRGRYPGQSLAAYLGGRSLSLFAFLTTGHVVTDTVTALKLFRTGILKPLRFVTTGFELDHEITARILARGHVVREVPISYFPRGRDEGKKIGLKDWFRAIRTFYQHGSG